MPTLSIEITPNRLVSGSRGLTMGEVIPHLVGHTIAEIERELIFHTLVRFCGSRTQSARVLGISIRCMRNKIREYEDLGIGVPAPGERSNRTDQELTPSEFPLVEQEDPINLKLKHIQVTYFPFERQFHSETRYRNCQRPFFTEDHMRMSIAPLPSPIATIAQCPQCGSEMNIKLIEPDLKEPGTARHSFLCDECGLPRNYLIRRERGVARH